MGKFQVQYKNNSRTFTDIFEANSYNDIINFFNDVINAELTEIREVLYESTFYPKDDGDYIKSASALLKDDNTTIYSLKLPKLKKTISKDTLVSLIKTHIKVNNKTPQIAKINNFF